MMVFMVIEHFRPGRAPAVYRRFRDRGRLAPTNVRYVSSWVDLNFAVASKCHREPAAAHLMMPGNPGLLRMVGWVVVSVGLMV